MPYAVVGSEVRSMFGSIAKRYDLANSVLSFGMHHVWRRQLLQLVPPNPQAAVLDLCTGTGDLLPLLMKRYGKVVGGDFCFPMLTLAQEKLERRKLPVPDLVQCDAMQLQFADASFDLITVAFGVRNFEDTRRGLSEMRRVLKLGGDLLILEFGQPSLPGFRALYSFYTKYLLPKIGGLVSGNSAAYSYLQDTSSRFPCGSEFVSLLESCSFKVQCMRPLNFGAVYAYHAKKI